jgi:hypothetical protein
VDILESLRRALPSTDSRPFSAWGFKLVEQPVTAAQITHATTDK